MSEFEDSFEGIFDEDEVRDLRAIMTSAADQALAGAMTAENLKRMAIFVTITTELFRGLEESGMTKGDTSAAAGGLFAQILYKYATGGLDELKELLGDE